MIEFARFLIEKLVIAVAIGHFYSEKLANYSLRKMNHDLFRVFLMHNDFTQMPLTDNRKERRRIGKGNCEIC